VCRPRSAILPPGDRSAYGLPGEYGVLLLDVPDGSLAAKAGLVKDDVILAANGKPARTLADLQAIQTEAAGKALPLEVRRKQATLSLSVTDYPFAVIECQPGPDFKTVPMAPAADVAPAKIVAGPPGTMNEPVAILTDGKLAGTTAGLRERRGEWRLQARSRRRQGHRPGTHLLVQPEQEPGPAAVRPVRQPGGTDPAGTSRTARLHADHRGGHRCGAAGADFLASSIRQGDGRPLGSYRWLVWAVAPATGNAGGENTAFQELQVILAPRDSHRGEIALRRKSAPRCRSDRTGGCPHSRRRCPGR